jgi:hypothetical protein
MRELGRWRRRVVSKEYREFADECLGWAKTARGDRVRRILLQMAETWLEAAAHAAPNRGWQLATTAACVAEA